MAIVLDVPGNSSGQPGGSLFLDRVLGGLMAFSQRLRFAVTNDVLVSASIGTSDTVVPHGLGEVPRGWEVVDLNANAVVWRSGDATKSGITLRASAPVDVVIRFT
jgi:hypothetical protein